MSTEPKWTFADFQRAAKRAGAQGKYDCVLVPHDGADQTTRSDRSWPDRESAEEWQRNAYCPPGYTWQVRRIG